MKNKLPYLVFIVIFLFVLQGCSSGFSAPQELTYDGNLITWESVSGASSYEISINNQTPVELSDTQYTYAAQGLEFTVTVTAFKKVFQVLMRPVHLKHLDHYQQLIQSLIRLRVAFLGEV